MNELITKPTNLQRIIEASLTLTVLAISLAVTCVAFAVSFHALTEYALRGGLTEQWAWALPVMIDGAVIACSLIGLYCAMFGHKVALWVIRGLILLATAVTIYLNYDYSFVSGGSWIVHTVAPIVYPIIFEVVIWLLQTISDRSINIQRADLISSNLAALKAQMTEKSEKLDKLKDSLSQEKDRLNQVKAEYQDTLEAIKAAGKDRVRVYAPVSLGINQRREIVEAMLTDGIPTGSIAASFQVSESTIKADRKLINAGRNGQGAV